MQNDVDAERRRKESLQKHYSAIAWMSKEAAAEQRRTSKEAGSSHDHLKMPKIQSVEEATRVLVKFGMASVLKQLDE